MRALVALLALLLSAGAASAQSQIGQDARGGPKALTAADPCILVAAAGHASVHVSWTANTLDGTLLPKVSRDGGATTEDAIFISLAGVDLFLASPNAAGSRGVGFGAGVTHAGACVGSVNSGSITVSAWATQMQTPIALGTDGTTLRAPVVTNSAPASDAYAYAIRCVSGCSGSGGTSMTDDAAFTVGTTAFTPIGGTYKSTLDAVDDNDGGAFAMTQKRALHTACYTPNGDSCDDDTNDARRVTLVTTATVGGQSATATTLPYPNGAGNLAAFIRPTTATTTLWITGESSEHIYVTSMLLHASGTQGVLVVSGTGATCGTGTETVLGEVELSTTNGTGFTLGNGNGMVLRTKDAGDSLCITTDSATALNALATYAIY